MVKAIAALASAAAHQSPPQFPHALRLSPCRVVPVCMLAPVTRAYSMLGSLQAHTHTRTDPGRSEPIP